MKWIGIVTWIKKKGYGEEIMRIILQNSTNGEEIASILWKKGDFYSFSNGFFINGQQIINNLDIQSVEVTSDGAIIIKLLELDNIFYAWEGY